MSTKNTSMAYIETQSLVSSRPQNYGYSKGEIDSTWEYVNMVVTSRCFALRAPVTQARIWKLDKFTLFIHSLIGWNLENL